MGKKSSHATGTALSEGAQPNDLWCADYKGEFPLGNQVYCHPLADIDGWVRHRLRAVQLKHRKRGQVNYRELIAREMSDDAARRVAANGRRWWRNSAMALHLALPNTLFETLGVPRLGR